MSKYICNACGYVYDPELGDPDSGIAPGTKFEDLPDSWTCPLCGVSKAEFSEEQVFIDTKLNKMRYILWNGRRIYLLVYL